jgi:hypothetical protein
MTACSALLIDWFADLPVAFSFALGDMFSRRAVTVTMYFAYVPNDSISCRCYKAQNDKDFRTKNVEISPLLKD